jgi:hypothetical protein
MMAGEARFRMILTTNNRTPNIRGVDADKTKTAVRR